MKKYLCDRCDKCKKNEAEYRVRINLFEFEYVCDDCLDEENDDYIPLDELEMDDEERDGCNDLIEHLN